MINALFVGYIKEDTKKELAQLFDYEFSFYESFKDVPEKVFEKTEVVVGQFQKEYLEKTSHLKLVQLLSAGVEHTLWLPEEILLANAYGAYAQGIAEYMLACALSIHKQLPFYQQYQKEHVWEEMLSGVLINELKVLSVGMGSIGSAFLEKMATLGATCYGVKRTLENQPDFVEKLYTFETMQEILPECDIVALSLPETDETKNLFNKDLLHLCKKDAILINVGRGTAIVSEDLIEVMNEGYFKGVYLDVFPHEPLPKNDAFWRQERLFITPHIAGRYQSDANYQNVMNVIKENLQRYSSNQPLLHIVDRKVGY